MRQSNASLAAKALGSAADDIMTIVFSCLKDQNIAVGITLKRVILDRVSAKLDEFAASGNGDAE